MNFKSRLIVNVLSNYGAFIVDGLCTFILVGYVVRKLGEEAFGLVSLVASIAGMTSILAMGVSSSLTKYLAEIKSPRDNAYNILLTSGFAWYFTFGIIGAIILSVIAGHLSSMFNIPPSLARDGQVGMYLMAAQVFLSFPLNIYLSALWAGHRYDLSNIARIGGISFRLLSTIIIFEFVRSGVIELIVCTISSILLERLIWRYFVYRYISPIQFRFDHLQWKVFKQIFNFGGIMLIINMANILGYEAIKWVVGVEMSVQDIGGYALIATIGVFIGTLVRSIAFVLVPAASQINALGEHAKNSYLALVSTKSAMIIASGLCIAPLFLYKNILVLWVGHTYQESYLNTMAQAVVIMLIAQTFICAAVCLLQMMTGIGKILVPGCVTMSWAVLGLSTVWAYIHWQKKSLVDVVVIISAARIIGSLVHLCYGLWVFKLSTQFVKDAIFRPVMAGLICMFLAIGLKYSIEIRSVYSFSMVALILVVSYMLLIWIIVLNKDEKALVHNYLTKAMLLAGIK